MRAPPKLTDIETLRIHRRRAARNPVSFLHELAADELKERLAEVNKSFTRPLLVGNVTEPIARLVPDAPSLEDAPVLSVERGAHDLVVHAFSLHWADDPVGQLVQARIAMEPDGLFLAVAFGGATLAELRAVLAEAESRVTGGLSPRVLPMADLRDLGDLLGRSGFALPVADSRRVTVRYPSLAKLAKDIRGMGEANAQAARSKVFTRRSVFDLAEQIYSSNFTDEDGMLTATFELVFLTGWVPCETQQRPLSPGSASHKLADALGVQEHGANDPVRRPSS